VIDHDLSSFSLEEQTTESLLLLHLQVISLITTGSFPRYARIKVEHIALSLFTMAEFGSISITTVLPVTSSSGLLSAEKYSAQIAGLVYSPHLPFLYLLIENQQYGISLDTSVGSSVHPVGIYSSASLF
jgi:hypothetical protein